MQGTTDHGFHGSARVLTSTSEGLQGTFQDHVITWLREDAFWWMLRLFSLLACVLVVFMRDPAADAEVWHVPPPTPAGWAGLCWPALIACLCALQTAKVKAAQEHERKSAIGRVLRHHETAHWHACKV